MMPSYGRPQSLQYMNMVGAGGLSSSEADASRDSKLAFWQKMNEQIARANIGMDIFADLNDSNYGKAATSVGALLSPLQHLNSKLMEVNGNYKTLGVTIEDVAASTQFHATQVSSIFDRARSMAMSFPNMLRDGLNRGMQMESTYISAAAGIVRSEFTNSIDEGQQIIGQVKDVVRRMSAPLPGDTNTHMLIAQNTVDDSFKLAKDADVDIDEAKDFAAWVAGQIGAIAGVQGADDNEALRFANALMSGTLSAKSQLNMVERNPALKAAITDTLKEQGVEQFYQISKDKQMGAMTELLEKAFPKDQLEASSNTLDGAMQGFNTGIKAMKDMTRVLEKKYDMEISVYQEMRSIAMRVLLPAAEILERLTAPDFGWDPMKLLQTGMSQLVPLMGGTGMEDADLKGMEVGEAQSLGGFDRLQWLNANLSGGKELLGDEGMFQSPDQILRFFQSSLDKFQTGWDEAMARLAGWLKFTEIIPTRSIANLAGKILAEIVNSVSSAKASLIPVIRDFMVELFLTIKENLDIVAIFSFMKEFHSIMQLFERMKGAISNVEKIPSLFSGLGKGLVSLTAVVGTTALAMGILVGALKMTQKGGTGIEGFFRPHVEGIFSHANARAGKEVFGPGAVKNTVEGLSSPLWAFSNSGPGKWLLDQDNNMKAADEKISKLNPLTWIFPNRGTNKPKNIDPHFKRGADISGDLSGKLGMAAGMMPILGQVPGIASIPILGQMASMEGAIGMGLASGAMKMISGGLNLAGERDDSGKARFALPESKTPQFLKNFLKMGENIMGSINPGMMLSIGKALSMFMAWAATFAAFLFAIYKNSPELQSAVKRFLNGLMEFFTWLDERFRILFKPIQKILAGIGRVLAFFLNMVSNILGFDKTGSIDTSSVNDRLLRQASGQREERISIANAAADASYMGHNPFLLNTIATASSGRIGNLMAAALTESRNSPPGAGLIVANSSETIRTAEQEKAIQAQLGVRGGRGLHIETINIEVVGIQSEEGPLGVGNEIARVLIGKLREFGENPR